MKPVIPRVIDARHAGNFRIWLRFADGLTGEIDIERELWGPVFEPLKDLSEFAKLYVDAECRTVVWPYRADLAPEFLYEELKTSLAAQHAAE